MRGKLPPEKVGHEPCEKGAIVPENSWRTPCDDEQTEKVVMQKRRVRHWSTRSKCCKLLQNKFRTFIVGRRENEFLEEQSSKKNYQVAELPQTTHLPPLYAFNLNPITPLGTPKLRSRTRQYTGLQVKIYAFDVISIGVKDEGSIVLLVVHRSEAW